MFGLDRAAKKSADAWTPEYLAYEMPKSGLLRRLERLRQQRSPFEKRYREVAQYIRPEAYIRSVEDTTKLPSDWGSIYNNKPALASDILMNGMQSGISSPTRPWLRLSVPDRELSEWGAVKVWLKSCSDKMNINMAKSNFYNTTHGFYGSCADFGTAAYIINEDYQTVINCMQFDNGEFFAATDYRGYVRTIYREYTETVENLVIQHGRRTSVHVQNLYDRGSYDELIVCVQTWERNVGQVPDERGIKGMPYVSCKMEKYGDADRILECVGYEEWPAPCARWHVKGNHPYGEGPGFRALGDSKALQVLELKKAMLIDKSATPPVTAPTALRNAPVAHRAGGVTYVGDGQNARAQPLYQVDPNAIQYTGLEIKNHEERIDMAYMGDLWRMVSLSDRRQVTAREIEEGHEEKLLQIGPTLERQHSEHLNVAVARTFNIMARGRLFPPPPKELEGQELRVEYVSLLAAAQKLVSLGATERLAGFIGNLAAGKPDVLDKFDFDQAVDVYGNDLAVDPSLIRSDDDVAKIREDRAEQEQNAQAMQAGVVGADTAKVLSDAKLSDPNMLRQLVGGAGVA